MSFVKLNQNNFAMTSVVLNADRKFVSSSTGITGALKVIVDRSHTQKDNIDDRAGLTGENRPQPFGENTYEGRRQLIMEVLRVSGSHQPHQPQDWFGDNHGELELGQLLDGSGVLAGHPPPEYEKYGIDPVNDPFTETGYSDISMHPRNSTELLVRALKPTSSMFSSGSMALTMAERMLEPYYKPINHAIGSKFVNFNCMNFFQASGLRPTLMYHTRAETNGNKQRHLHPNTGDLYTTTGLSSSKDLSFEFWIKLRDTTKTGTVIHYPGQFSISIISGSEQNEQGMPTTYGLGIALGQNRTQAKADLPYNLDFGVTSKTAKSTFSLRKDIWSHCAITYRNATNDLNIYIDGKRTTSTKFDTFYRNNTYRGLFIGSYWNGSSADILKLTRDSSQGNDMDTLGSFAADEVDVNANFDCQLNADLHEIRIWKKTLSAKQINDYLYTTYTGSYSDHRERGLLLYVPCLYDVDYRSMFSHTITPEFAQGFQTVKNRRPEGFDISYDNLPTFQSTTYLSAIKALTGSIKPEFTELGSIFGVTPHVTRKLLAAPYNTHHANIGNFANVNIQSFLKDYANMTFPYCIHLSESLGDYQTSPTARAIGPYYQNFASNYTTNHVLTSSFKNKLGHQARNAFILPCDNGNFRADYNTLFHPTGSKFVSNNGFYINTKNIGDINDLFDTRLFFIDDVFAARGSFAVAADGATTNQGGDARYNDGLTQFSVLDDENPNTDLPDFQIPSTDNGEFAKVFDENDFPGPLTTIITIPQLYYGRRIKPGSIKLFSNLYNGNQSRIELRDNGYGVMYRHQTSGSVANWNKVGDVYYGEGLIYIRHPSLYAIADNNLQIEFKSESEVNVFEASIPCNSMQFNSSSNPNYNRLKPSSNDNESADEFVYISTVYLHDENLNVVAKAKLAQPVIKRPENKYLFRVKMDY